MENNSSLLNDNRMMISKKFLLSVYAILPILFGVIMVDKFYLDSSLLPHFGVNGLALPLYLFLFGLPHIIGSFFSFFDGEYLDYYRKYLFFYLPGLLIATAILLFVNFELGVVFFLVNDVWHGIKQKVGIALILGSKLNWLHYLWTALPFITSSLAFVYFLMPQVFPIYTLPYISPIIFIGAILLFFTMLAKIRESKPDVRLYIFLVSVLFFFNYYFILTGYIFFAILAFRVVHDASAFAFYIAHDYNRNVDGYKNIFYKLLSVVPLPVLVLTPALSILFAYFVRTATNGITIGYGIVILICMSHYYLESVMWKRNAPHRKYVKVV